ncbi:hypothetical protein BCR42DRAFT_429198 [Absidia repens]|uniref:Uncharacterized protein n=1 Tax=Absidia repens TaxID=90262 RepID=A0A1X2HYS0_9FUNG|nr:hypothetical protein BCR42DRAFT_429198 [Absidia repens]
MDAKDKLNLLFFSSYRKHDMTLILPTFATITIYWHFPVSDFFMMMGQDVDNDDNDNDGEEHRYFNFDLTKDDEALILHHTQDDNGDDLYYLCLTPFEYYVHNDYHHHKEACREFLLGKTALCKRLGLDDSDDPLDVVAIPNLASGGGLRSLKQEGAAASLFWVHLIGSFAKNIWVFDKCSLSCSPTDPSEWIRHDSHDNNNNINNSTRTFSGFHIY